MTKLKVMIKHKEKTPWKDVIKLKASVMRYMEFLTSEDYYEEGIDGYKNEIYEFAVEMVYGKDVWKEVRRLRHDQEVIALKQRHAQELQRMINVHEYTEKMRGFNEEEEGGLSK